MSSKTKIIVLKTKELIYTAVFILLGLLLILLFVNMFSGEKAKETSVKPAELSEEASYIPGVYTELIPLSPKAAEVSITLDRNHINSISFSDLPQETAALYPLLSSTMSSLSNQILSSQTLEVSFSPQIQYTSEALLKAIQACLSKALIHP